LNLCDEQTRITHWYGPVFQWHFLMKNKSFASLLPIVPPNAFVQSFIDSYKAFMSSGLYFFLGNSYSIMYFPKSGSTTTHAKEEQAVKDIPLFLNLFWGWVFSTSFSSTQRLRAGLASGRFALAAPSFGTYTNTWICLAPISGFNSSCSPTK
jgi:hypothetical protein